MTERVRAANGDYVTALAAAASASLRGDLSQVGLGTLLALVVMERKTGVLVLKSPEGHAEITIRDGEVLSAELLGGAKPAGADCIYELLRWNTGTFELVALDETRSRARLARGTSSPVDEHSDEWSEDTPLMMAAKLAELVRQMQHASQPPLAAPKLVIEEIVRPEAVDDELPAPRAVHHVRWIAVAATLASAGAALPVIADALIAPSDADAIAHVRADADQLANAIETTAAAARAHVKNLATTPLLRAGIETDAPTIADLADHESLFAPIDGAIVEVFQIQNGAAVSMVRRPASAPALPAASDDRAHVASDGRGLSVVVTAPVAAQSGNVAGALSLALPCELANLRRSIAEHAVTATLTGIDHPITLLASNAHGEPVSIAIAGGDGLALAAVIAAPDAPAWPGLARYTLFGMAGLVLAGYGLARRRR